MTKAAITTDRIFLRIRTLGEYSFLIQTASKSLNIPNEIKILINTNTSLYDSYYDSLSVKRQAASMNFIHEVGHALMLSHPKQDARLSGHTKNVGKPYAVMNEGLPFLSVKPEVSPTPTSHDTDCLKGKWGV